MYKRFVVKTSYCLILLLMIIITVNLSVTFASVHYTELIPEKPVQGDIIEIFVYADPNEEVPIVVFFKEEVAISDGKYSYELIGVIIPSTSNTFTITGENVTNLIISTRIFDILEISQTIQAKDGIAIIS